jgi:hypothetical protein
MKQCLSCKKTEKLAKALRAIVGRSNTAGIFLNGDLRSIPPERDRELDGGAIKYSSMSVAVTESRELAEAIHALAKSCEARKTDVYSISGVLLVLRKHRAGQGIRCDALTFPPDSTGPLLTTSLQ